MSPPEPGSQTAPTLVTTASGQHQATPWHMVPCAATSSALRRGVSDPEPRLKALRHRRLQEGTIPLVSVTFFPARVQGSSLHTWARLQSREKERFGDRTGSSAGGGGESGPRTGRAICGAQSTVTTGLRRPR